MSASQDSARKKVSPRALVRKQVENEGFHVSEEDFANLDTSIESTDNKDNELAEQINNKDKENTVTPYDILGE